MLSLLVKMNIQELNISLLLLSHNRTGGGTSIFFNRKFRVNAGLLHSLPLTRTAVLLHIFPMTSAAGLLQCIPLTYSAQLLHSLALILSSVTPHVFFFLTGLLQCIPHILHSYFRALLLY